MHTQSGHREISRLVEMADIMVNPQQPYNTTVIYLPKSETALNIDRYFGPCLILVLNHIKSILYHGISDSENMVRPPIIIFSYKSPVQHIIYAFYVQHIFVITWLVSGWSLHTICHRLVTLGTCTTLCSSTVDITIYVLLAAADTTES